MKFTKFGKALLMSALSAGVILCVTSCVRSYTVGYIYVTGTVTAQSSGNGIISGYNIDHNTGFLTPLRGFPVSSGGANPGRFVLVNGSRFMYVLNQGVNSTGGSVCTTDDPCQNSNITQFDVGGNGILTSQEVFYTQGINPFRLIADSTGQYLLVLDHDSPAPNGEPSSPTNPNPACQLALGGAATSCADVTVFKIDQSTGRLTLVVNAQVTSANGSALTYFPVPSNPIDFQFAQGSTLLTLGGTPTIGDSVFPYAYNSTSGQLTLTQNSSQALGIHQATALYYVSTVIYVLDNEAPNPNPTAASSQILPYTLGLTGALQAETGGIIPDDPTLSNPSAVLLESKGKFLYVANQGNNVQGTNAGSGMAGWFLTTTPSYEVTPLSPSTFGTGSGPQCIVEDPSNQFIYTANHVDSSISGRAVDPNDGVLNPFTVAGSYQLQGQPNWCLIDGRTN
jgi:6-phosphogluconolactonase (cycloisomerase 2 family)